MSVRADQQRVTQVLRVLVDNALQFSPPGSPVEVRAGRTAGSTRVEVRDRGKGVSVSDRRRIFGRGVKLDPSRPGAGLGLYVAAGLLGGDGGRGRRRAAGGRRIDLLVHAAGRREIVAAAAPVTFS